MKISIDRNNPTPIYYQAVEQVQGSIARGVLKAFQKLPTEHELANVLSINRMTASRIYQELENAGLVQRIQGKGTFVADITTKGRKKAFGTKKTIGVVFPAPAIGFFTSDVLRGIQDAAKEKKYEVIMANSANKPKTEVRLINRFTEMGIRHLIIWPCDTSYKNRLFYSYLIKKEVPFVFIDRYLKNVAVSHVITDNMKGAYKIVQYLIKLGHQIIAHITSPAKNVTTVQDRLRGYKQALIDHNIELDPSLIVECHPSGMVDSKDSIGGIHRIVNCQKAVKKLLNLKNRPTAIFACNDYMAISTITELKIKGLKIPEAIAVVGYDNIPLTAQLEVPLTTIAQPGYDIGRASVKMLLNGGNKKRGGIDKVILPSKLVIRKSSGKRLIKI